MSTEAAAPALPTTIASFLRRARLRLRLHRAVAGALCGLAAGLAVSVAVALAARLRPLLSIDQILISAAIAAGGGFVLGALAGAGRPLRLRAVAAHCDREFGLREHLATALELSTGRTRSALAAPQLAETAALLAGRRPGGLALPRPDQRLIAALATLALLWTILVIAPNRQAAILQQQVANQQLMQQAAQQVAQMRAQVQAQADLDPATRQALDRQLAQLERDLASGNADRTQAVVRIAEAQAELRKLQDPNAQRGAAGLPGLADEFKPFAATADIGDRLAKGDYSGAGQALQALGGQLEGLDPSSQAALANKLRDAAASQAATNPQVAQQLQDAADALARGDIAAAQQALDRAGATIAQTGQQAAAQNQVSQTLGDLDQIKRDVAAGQPPSTANATPQRPAGSPSAAGSPAAPTAPAGSPAAFSGTPVAQNSQGTPITLSGTPINLSGLTPISPNGTPAASSGTGTPVAIAQGTATGTPVIVPAQGGASGGDASGGNNGGGAGDQAGASGSGGSQAGTSGGSQGGSNGSQAGNSGSGTSEQTPGASAPGQPPGGQGRANAGSDYDQVYAPTLPGGPAGQQQQVSGTGGSTAPDATTQTAGANGPSSVPYNQVYQQYADAAMQGLDNGSIPPELRDYIRQYFSDLDPQSNNK